MISVTEALDLIKRETTALPKTSIPLEESNGYYLAEPIIAPMSLPPFRQSAMDGYAFRHGDVTELEVIGECKAGDAHEFELQANQAVRIFTGARVPDQADTVIIQEHVEVKGKMISIQKLPAKSANVRKIGEQVPAGEQVLAEGLKITESIIGFLAGFGITEVLVFNKPKITLIVTGNELQEPGRPLNPGAIYESNAIMLKSALISRGFDSVRILKVQDDLESTKRVISLGLESDVLLISGGISVGDYDFVNEALKANGAKEIFYKVNQKPGKPIWFGKKGETLIFALPGNPASSLTCFLIYALSALQIMSGNVNYDLDFSTGVLRHSTTNKFGKTLFILGTEQDGQLDIYPKQASSMLISYALGNALILIPEEKEVLEAGERLSYLPINRN
ncbi:molybdopterin molybdotransferase MoeA [Algoriphagus halophytocola]|uniref:Molybdopterin molybdenumtransferase n=1 Tax=Algoriphagus halophytocola TaxID=2991499 RepID=A0ABY6MCR1_9BACT|nr:MULTISPECIES: gephyrin-like molybdotransferase Glp [unclassified Algoriphagus]UZD21497.1 molybdopterin molybdotransferase MoeA [Algoriphagus sp. TR-M5]WBL42709.1 molybdopterin molybdotransferase MoeA [Algoriphagus sp. TR-M9]